jgi:hypothetical protein
MARLARFEAQVLPHLDAAYNLARWITRNDHDAEMSCRRRSCGRCATSTA